MLKIKEYNDVNFVDVVSGEDIIARFYGIPWGKPKSCAIYNASIFIKAVEKIDEAINNAK
jgi:hypothetical protein